MNTPEEIMDRIAAEPNSTSFFVHFSSLPAALEVVKKLSFVEDSSKGMALPVGVHCGVFKSSTGAFTIIGGRLSSQATMEAFELFQKHGEIKSITLPSGAPPLHIQPKKVESKGLEFPIGEVKQKELLQPITPYWYIEKSDPKHVRQVVVTLPPESRIPPRVDNLVSGLIMAEAKWAAEILFLTGDTPEARGPFIFAKATGIVDVLKGCDVEVAFAFYRLYSGGIFQLFVQVNRPQVREKVGYPGFVAEHSLWLDEENDCRLVEALINREQLEVCFVSPGEKGPCTGDFGMRVSLPEELRNTLKQEWAELLTYHKGISSRDYQKSLEQYNQENPMSESPVLMKKIIIPYKPKKWWEKMLEKLRL
jgi:hypothetical protein